MKNTVKLLGIIAIVVMIGFSFTSCGGSDCELGRAACQGSVSCVSSSCAVNIEWYAAANEERALDQTVSCNC